MPETLPSLPSLSLGLGVSWRPELALAIARSPHVTFVELMVEHFPSHRPLPPAVEQLLSRGVVGVPHGLSLGLGGAEPPHPERLREIEALARRTKAPLVSEHLALVRSGELESGHLLPVERSPQSLEVVLANVTAAQTALSCPLYLENISALWEWPDPAWSEAEFLDLLLQKSGCGLLLDLANLYANCRNLGGDPLEQLEQLPLGRLGYVHVGGGVERAGIYHDTHSAPVHSAVLELTEELYARCEPPGLLLERDDDFPDEREFAAEMDRLAEAVERGRARRKQGECLR